MEVVITLLCTAAYGGLIITVVVLLLKSLKGGPHKKLRPYFAATQAYATENKTAEDFVKFIFGRFPKDEKSLPEEPGRALSELWWVTKKFSPSDEPGAPKPQPIDEVQLRPAAEAALAELKKAMGK